MRREITAGAACVSRNPDCRNSSDWNYLANGFLDMARVSDWEQFTPSMTWARGGLVMTGELDALFFQGDLSLSLGYPTVDDFDGYNIFHANGGVGAMLGPIRLMGEMANTMTYNADEVFWFHAVSLGVRYVSQSRWSPHVSYQIAFSSADGVAAHIVLAGVVYSVPAPRPDQWLALRR